MTHGNLPLLAPLFRESQHPVFPLVSEVLEPELGDSAHAGSGVDQSAQNSPVSQTQDVGGVQGSQQVSGLMNSEFGRLTVHDGVFRGLSSNGTGMYAKGL